LIKEKSLPFRPTLFCTKKPFARVSILASILGDKYNPPDQCEAKKRKSEIKRAFKEGLHRC